MNIGPEVAALPAPAPAASASAAASPAALQAAPEPKPPATPPRSALTAASVSFELDGETGKPIVRIVDPDSGKVIRQLPTQEMLEIARALGRIEGLMIRVKA
jgi:flagellar protein FlaG